MRLSKTAVLCLMLVAIASASLPTRPQIRLMPPATSCDSCGSL